MAKGTDEYFKQAYLKRDTKTGVQRSVSWIPENLAIPGQTIRLKNDDGTWTDPWLVTGTGDQRFVRAKALDLAHGAKKFRENTDI
jgi:hypothetical protein